MKKLLLFVVFTTISVLSYGQTNQVIDYNTCKDEIIEHSYYTLCLNHKEHVPNWVSYHLTKDEATNAVGPRKNAFKTDPKSPKFSATPADYHLSGFDQGHIFSWASNQWNKTAATECFYMTNMAPQIHEFNAGSWEVGENLERHSRDILGDVYYIAGVLKFNKHIGVDSVGVPEIWWKVFIDFKNHQEIAFVFYQSDNWVIHPMSVTDLEKIIGLNITPNETADVEGKFDLNHWGYNDIVKPLGKKIHKK